MLTGRGGHSRQEPHKQGREFTKIYLSCRFLGDFTVREVIRA